MLSSDFASRTSETGVCSGFVAFDSDSDKSDISNESNNSNISCDYDIESDASDEVYDKSNILEDVFDNSKENIINLIIESISSNICNVEFKQLTMKNLKKAIYKIDKNKDSPLTIRIILTKLKDIYGIYQIENNKSEIRKVIRTLYK